MWKEGKLQTKKVMRNGERWVCIVLTGVLLLHLVGCSRTRTSNGSDGREISADTLATRSSESTVHETRIDITQLRSSQESDDAVIIYRTGDTTNGITISALYWKDRSVTQLFFLPPDEAKRCNHFEVSYAGVLASVGIDSAGRGELHILQGRSRKTIRTPFPERQLSDWNAKSGPRFDNDSTFPAFSLSPDGSTIVAYGCYDYSYSDSSHGTVSTKFTVAQMHIGEDVFHISYVDTISTAGYFADQGFSRSSVGWVKTAPPTLLFSGYHSGQLTGKYEGLYQFDGTSGSFKLLSSSVEKYLSCSFDGQHILYTNNDETCCDGINYTDNQLILWDCRTSSSHVMFDEYATFHNENKGEDHVPMNAELSPNNQWVATTISSFVDSTAKSSLPGDSDAEGPFSLYNSEQLFVSRSDGTNRRIYDDRELVGWLDDGKILVLPVKEEWDPMKLDKVTTKGRLKVLNIQDGVESDFLDHPVEIVAIQWMPRK